MNNPTCFRKSAFVFCLVAMTLFSACVKDVPVTKYLNKLSFEMNGVSYLPELHPSSFFGGGSRPAIDLQYRYIKPKFDYNYDNIDIDEYVSSVTSDNCIDSLFINARVEAPDDWNSLDYWAEGIKLNLSYSQVKAHVGERFLVPAKDVTVYYYRHSELGYCIEWKTEDGKTYLKPVGKDYAGPEKMIATEPRHKKDSHPQRFELYIDSADFTRFNPYSLEFHFCGEGEVALEDRTETYSITNGYFRYDSDDVHRHE